MQLRRIIYTLTFVCLALSHKLHAQTSTFKVTKLKNGLDIVAMESNKVPLVTIVLAVKAGAMTETPDINGLTHLWEHMFFKGNKALPNQEAFKQRVRELGIIYNGDTSSEKVRYYFTMPSAWLEEGLKFMADAITSPLLEKEELKKERKVVIDEYDRNASQPGFRLYHARRNLLYGTLSYRRNPLGTRDNILNTNRAQLLRIKKEVFVPKNSAILVGGDFDPTKLNQLVKKYFSDWKNPPNWKLPSHPQWPKFPQSQELVVTHPQAQNVILAMTYNGPRAKEDIKATFAADMLITLLNQRSGKFYRKYMDSGLTLGASLGYHTQAQTGELHVSAQVKAENAKKVKKMLLKEPMQWLKKDYFSDKEIENAKRSLLVNRKYEINKPSEYVKNLAFWWAITGLDYYQNYLPNLQKVSRKDIQDFVKKYFQDKSVITSYFLSPDEAKKLDLKDNSKKFMNKS